MGFTLERLLNRIQRSEKAKPFPSTIVLLSFNEKTISVNKSNMSFSEKTISVNTGVIHKKTK